MSDVEMEDAGADGGVLAQSSATNARGGLTPEASRLFRVYKTISAMLGKRGYMVPREMRDMTPASFTERFGEFPTREGLTILVVRFCVIFGLLSCMYVLILLFLMLLSPDTTERLTKSSPLFIDRKNPTTNRISCSYSSPRTKRLESSQSRCTPTE